MRSVPADRAGFPHLAGIGAVLRTADLQSEGATIVSTAGMGEAIVKEMQALHG